MLKALICDIDGTLTDRRRRISSAAVECLRNLIDHGIEVTLASGNTACFMDAISKMIGTSGTFIAENGGVYRVGYDGELHIFGDQALAWDAFRKLEAHFRPQGKRLNLYSPNYRFSDVAFGPTVDVEEVRSVLSDFPIRVVHTGFAIHLLSPDFNKGIALSRLARAMGLESQEFMSIGDSENDTEMLAAAGIGIAVENAHPKTKDAAAWVTSKPFGEGVVEAIAKYRHLFSTDR